jgi:hypothetical protein
LFSEGVLVKVVWHFAAVATGSALGTCLFIAVVIFTTGDPLKDWLESSLGILLHRQPDSIDPITKQVAIAMVERGVVVTPDALIGSITNLYGNMIQVLVGVFSLFAILSFFAIRWQSIQQAEAFVETKVDKSLLSDEFTRRLTDLTINTFDTYSVNIQESLENYSKISERLTVLEMTIAENASEEEPEE